MNRLIRSLCLVSTVLALGVAAPGDAEAKGPRPPAHRPPRIKIARRVPTAPPLDPANVREIRSELMATSERAENDLRVQFEKSVSAWLAENDVPATWKAPKRLLDRMYANKVFVEPVKIKDLDVYRASTSVEFSPHAKRELLDAYGRQVAGQRLGWLGGIVAFVLACLAAISGYIRADEATKGYYTNQLRLVAAAGVGVAGAVVYQILT